jgi:peptidoglycan hydrolase-like protein with peptidoglycan-binding domain
MTGDALRTYQAQNGLEATGHLDAVTLERLTRVDMDDLDARDVQQRLIDLGYLQGTADGVIGPRSIAALEQFQRMNGLEPNGKANKATLETLYGDDVVTLPDSLSQGSKGEAVGRLQRRLAQFGFFEGEVDESYGQSTANAVAAFQRHLIAQGHGEEIVDDGAASPMTQYCLFAEDYSSYLRDVTPGVSDSEAERIERRLYELGYPDLPADDVLDDDSVAALMLFKGEAEVDTPDATDQATIDALFSKSAPKAEFCVPHAIAKGDSGQVVRDVEEALVRGGMMTKMPTGKYSDAVEKAVERLYGYLVSQKDPNAPLFADSKALSADAVERLVDGLLAHCADPGDEYCGILTRCTASYHDDGAGRHTNILYGDYFLTEALMRLCGRDPELWS